MGTNEDWNIKRKKYPNRLTRAKAIKIYCKEECCAGDMESWKNCTFDACFLWNFRLGREVLGNRTSFKKNRRNNAISDKNEHSIEELKP